MDAIRIVIDVVMFVLGLGAGLVFGRRAERRHLASLVEREALHMGVLVTDSRNPPADCDATAGAELVVAEVCIASDYLKTFLAGIRNFFGGEMRSLESLLLRARREAIMRLVEQARARGFDAVINVRLDTADIGGTSKGGGTPFASVLASGTACRRLPASASAQG